MPIKKENRHRYPPRSEWLHIRVHILKRANHQCEFCGVQNYTIRMNARIVLSVAHLDQQPENNHPSNLAALCQRCHLAHDQPFRMYHSWQTRFDHRHAHTHDLFEYYR
jgi:5-methylcytosine-specific restriction endonuclease McrA